MSDLQRFFHGLRTKRITTRSRTELATELLEKMANGGFQEGDLSERAQLCTDKETVNQSISARDAHLGKLLAHEDEVRPKTRGAHQRFRIRASAIEPAGSTKLSTRTV